jgi:hypothetical protein
MGNKQFWLSLCALISVTSMLVKSFAIVGSKNQLGMAEKKSGKINFGSRFPHMNQ